MICHYKTVVKPTVLYPAKCSDLHQQVELGGNREDQTENHAENTRTIMKWETRSESNKTMKSTNTEKSP